MPGSVVETRGSLASGTADQFSDIDLLWEVPDEAFQGAADGAGAILERAQETASVRVDPTFRRSTKHRLVYARFRDLPLFWRLDLEIFAQSAARNPDYDRASPGAHDDTDWSPGESALMNAIATVRALRRGNDELAVELLGRGYERVGLPRATEASDETVRTLADAIRKRDPSVAPLAEQVRELVDPHSTRQEALEPNRS